MSRAGILARLRSAVKPRVAAGPSSGFGRRRPCSCSPPSGGRLQRAGTHTLTAKFRLAHLTKAAPTRRASLSVPLAERGHEVGIMRWLKHFSCPGATMALAGIVMGLHLVSGVGPASASSSEPFTFENADIQTVVAQVARLTGIPFVFDPERVTGKITLLSPKSVSPTEALELLKSVLALHGYALVRRAEATWIVPADRAAAEGFTIKVVPLTYAHVGELAYTLSRIAPPSIRIAPHYPTNSLIISGHPAAVEELIGTVK
jgi:hypothetical protein